MNPTVVGIVLIVAIVGYSIFSVTYKQKAGLKKAQSGEDKARVRKRDRLGLRISRRDDVVLPHTGT